MEELVPNLARCKIHLTCDEYWTSQLSLVGINGLSDLHSHSGLIFHEVSYTAPLAMTSLTGDLKKSVCSLLPSFNRPKEKVEIYECSFIGKGRLKFAVLKVWINERLFLLSYWLVAWERNVPTLAGPNIAPVFLWHSPYVWVSGSKFPLFIEAPVILIRGPPCTCMTSS